METSFASRVKEFRKFKGLSQEAFAERCGLEQGNITQMERGTDPKSSNAAKIVAGFPDLSAEWLLAGTGPMLRDGRTLTPYDQLPPAVPSKLEEPKPAGFPATPGTATPLEADFVGRLIHRLETELADAKAREEQQQRMIETLLGKSPASAYAATPAEPRQEIAGFRTAATAPPAPVECKLIVMWKPVVELEKAA